MTLNCDLAGTCAGCPWIEETLTTQHSRKMEHFRSLWQEQHLDLTLIKDLEIEALAEGGLRDRADLTLYREASGMCLGLYDRDHKHILHMSHCPMMTPALAAWHAEFATKIPDLRLGGLRLRVAPDGQRGLWLDFPNSERDRFLAEGTWLRLMAEHAVVEMGQKRQRLNLSHPNLELGDPELYPWFETYLGLESKPQPLYCSIGTFTQPGFAINRLLVTRVLERARQIGAQHWLELGSGIGNFSLPLAAEGFLVNAVENDPRALAGLQRSAKEAGLAAQITITAANMHRRDPFFLQHLSAAEALLIDPPRSGLRGFLDVMEQQSPNHRPRHLLYISCFAASLIEDSARLIAMGYQLENAHGIDQFPQSPHNEWILSFSQS